MMRPFETSHSSKKFSCIRVLQGRQPLQGLFCRCRSVLVEVWMLGRNAAYFSGVAPYLIT